MGFLQRLGLLSGAVSASTLEDHLDKVIQHALSAGFYTEEDGQNLWVVESDSSSFCANYADNPVSLKAADAWIRGRVDARASVRVAARLSRNGS